MTPLCEHPDGPDACPNHRPRKAGLARGVSERLFSMGVWTWLAIIEQEADSLSEGGRNALALLREDLERMARSLRVDDD